MSHAPKKRRVKFQAVRSGRDISALLKPLYNVASHQIRQHFVDPKVILVLAGAHPSAKIVIANPSQEIFHEIRTINLILKKNRVRMRMSATHLRKEINNLQRQVSIIIESLDGYKALSKSIFSEDSNLRKVKNFKDFEEWKDQRMKKNKETDKPLFDAVDDGEISIDSLDIIEKIEKEKIVTEFYALKEDSRNENIFHEEKYFNLLERIQKVSPHRDISFDEIINDLKIVRKNASLLHGGLKHNALAESTIETLKEMLNSKYAVIKELAQKILKENTQIIKEKIAIQSNFPSHKFDKNIYSDALKKVSKLT